MSIFSGIGFALMYMPALVSIDWYFKGNSSFATGIAVCGTGVGTLVLSYAMNGIVNIRSWLNYSNALLVEAGIILFGLVCGFLMVIDFVFFVFPDHQLILSLDSSTTRIK